MTSFKKNKKQKQNSIVIICPWKHLTGQINLNYQRTDKTTKHKTKITRSHPNTNTHTSSQPSPPGLYSRIVKRTYRQTWSQSPLTQKHLCWYVCQLSQQHPVRSGKTVVFSRCLFCMLIKALKALPSWHFNHYRLIRRMQRTCSSHVSPNTVLSPSRVTHGHTDSSHQCWGWLSMRRYMLCFFDQGATCKLVS